MAECVHRAHWYSDLTAQRLQHIPIYVSIRLAELPRNGFPRMDVSVSEFHVILTRDRVPAPSD
jgi:hypothetical protein